MNSAFKEKKHLELLESKKVAKPAFSKDYAENTEIKKLDVNDTEEVSKLMRKALFEVTEKELREIIAYGLSFGAYVDRMLVGVGLAWPVFFDPVSKNLGEDQSNAIYLEEPAVLLAYEGRGIRRMLLKAREEEGKDKALSYAVSFVSSDIPKDGIEDYIKEGGSAMEKLYLSEGYEFVKTRKGLLAFKKL